VEALGKDQFFVERIESEELLLWKLTPSKAADIIIIFRVHIDALTELLSASFGRVRDAEMLRKQHEKLLRGGLSSSSELYAAMTDPSERRSVTREAEGASQRQLSEEIIRFLEKLRKILEQRKAVHLL
jgi:hypothetical protein